MMFGNSHERMLKQILENTEKIMGTTQTGLANLQAFVTQFQAFATQNTADNTALATAINEAITLLQASEDPQVQTAVTALQSSLTTIQANQLAQETLTANLGTAENPPAKPAVKA